MAIAKHFNYYYFNKHLRSCCSPCLRSLRFSTIVTDHLVQREQRHVEVLEFTDYSMVTLGSNLTTAYLGERAFIEARLNYHHSCSPNFGYVKIRSSYLLVIRVVGAKGISSNQNRFPFIGKCFITEV